jgi:hypothetical protein
MPSPECPVCHARVLLANGQPYCAKCGWNHVVAVTQLRSTLKTFPVSGLMFLAFGYFVIFRHLRHVNPNAALLVLAFPAAMIVLAYFLSRRRLNQLESLPNPVAPPRLSSAVEAGATASNTAQIAGNLEPSAKDQALLRTSRPREIQMSARGKFGIAMAVLFALGIATAIGIHLYTLWIPKQSFARFATSDWITLGVGFLLALVPYGVWRGQVKECDLLENGEVVLGKVTRQWNDNKSGPSIECNFADYQGQSHTLIAFDNSNSLYVGMPVPVFYDRDNPKRALAACASLHKVIT